MGRYVGIKKVISKGNKHYYMIETPGQIGSTSFYMAIDPNNKVLDFYEKESDFDGESAFTIDPLNHLPGAQAATKFRWAHGGTLLIALVKAKKALEANEFPDDISLCA